jgi:hypothetical protein
VQPIVKTSCSQARCAAFINNLSNAPQQDTWQEPCTSTSTTIVKARANVSGPRNTIGRRELRLHNIIIILLWHGLWLLPHRRCLTSPSWILHTWWIRGHDNNNNTSVIKSFSSSRLILIFDDHASIVGNQNGLETQKNYSSARHRSNQSPQQGLDTRRKRISIKPHKRTDRLRR